MTRTIDDELDDLESSLRAIDISQQSRMRGLKVIDELRQFREMDIEFEEVRDMIEKRTAVWEEDLEIALSEVVVGAEYYIDVTDDGVSFDSNIHELVNGV